MSQPGIAAMPPSFVIENLQPTGMIAGSCKYPPINLCSDVTSSDFVGALMEGRMEKTFCEVSKDNGGRMTTFDHKGLVVAQVVKSNYPNI
ncbi:unnamed protein product [Prunus armeniaca]